MITALLEGLAGWVICMAVTDCFGYRSGVIKWVKGLFVEEPFQIERYRDLRRQRIQDLVIPRGDWRHRGTMILNQYRYWCGCGTILTPGPQGGCAVNAVCEKCRINYGCLPGFFD